MKAKRRIHKFDFEAEKMASGAKTHVALVDKAANMTEALVMKSTYTRQSVEVENFEDDGTYSRDEYTVNTADYGGDVVHVTERTVRVIETAVPKVNIV